jgi:tRNA (cmo5U34)-methyltransferase
MKAFQRFDASAHFDEGLAAKYDRQIRMFCPSYDALHEIIPVWFRELPERANFLSAGAGTGAEILTLGGLFPSWRFTAVDASRDMLKACHDRISQAGMANRVTFFNGQLQEYESPAPYDAASSVFVSHFIKDRDEKLAYFHAVSSNLKPGGVFVLADLFGDKGSPSFRQLFDAWMVSYASHGVSGQELVKDRTHIDSDVSFIPESELFDLLNEAGFDAPIRFYQTLLFGGWTATKPIQERCSTSIC